MLNGVSSSRNGALYGYNYSDLQKKSLKKRRSRRVWVKPWLLKKQELSHVNLIRELQDIPEDWKNYLRVNKENYLDLLERITPLIKKQDNVMRSAITPHERLAATLRFLITGGSLEDLKFCTSMSAQGKKKHGFK